MRSSDVLLIFPAFILNLICIVDLHLCTFVDGLVWLRKDMEKGEERESERMIFLIFFYFFSSNKKLLKM